MLSSKDQAEEDGPAQRIAAETCKAGSIPCCLYHGSPVAHSSHSDLLSTPWMLCSPSSPCLLTLAPPHPAFPLFTVTHASGPRPHARTVQPFLAPVPTPFHAGMAHGPFLCPGCVCPAVAQLPFCHLTTTSPLNRRASAGENSVS